MENSVNLELPYIMPSQAQKHVTHNEALRILDTLVQLAVQDRDLNDPPVLPAEGERWIVKASPAPTGDWAGRGNHIAAWQDDGWQFSIPKTGWIAFVIDEGTLLAWNGSAWGDFFATVTSLQNLARLGVGTTADAANPFSAKLNNALWAARTAGDGGDGHLRLKLSKESSAKTLSLLFQDNFSGRAEIGLAGDDDFHFKVSPDGSAWIDALLLDKTTGAMKLNSAASLTGDISPAQITSDQNDYNPTGWSTASVLRMSSDANGGNGRALTGLAGGSDGRLAVVVNVGANPLVLKNQSSGSSAANRFRIGRNHALQADESALLIYDATDARWKLTGRKSRPVGTFHVYRNTNQGGLSAGFQKLQFETEAVDADNWYDNATNYRYTPQEPGWYWFYVDAQIAYGAASAEGVGVAIAKNNTIEIQGGPMLVLNSATITAGTAFAASLIQLNGSTDYVEFQVFCGGGSGTSSTNGAKVRNYAGGFKVADL